MKTRILLLSIISIGLFGASLSPSQEMEPKLIVPLRITDGYATIYDTLGCHWNASYCIDNFIDTNLVEVELPIMPPLVFDVRFVDHRPDTSCLGVGTRLHIQYFGLDTFRLRILHPDTFKYPIQVSWSFQDFGLAYWQSIKIGDSRESPITYVDMRSESTFVITDDTLTYLDIIGESSIDPVRETASGRPRTLELYQSYPNPFNSSTAISYYLPTRADVDISLYDLLGHRITTLIQGQQSSGDHQAQFNAGGYPSGIYLVRLSSGSSLQSTKLIYLK